MNFVFVGPQNYHYFLIVSDGIVENNLFSLSSKSVFFFNQFLENSVEILKKFFFFYIFTRKGPWILKKI
jgi:hypothetical protein